LGKIITDIIEDDFIKRSTSSYDLSILVGMDSFFYIVNDGQQNVLVLKSYQFDDRVDSFEALKQPFQKIFLEDKLLQMPFLRTKVAFINNKSTLVPSRLFDDKGKEAYLEHLLRLADDDVVQVDDLPILDTKNVYAVNKPVLNIARSYFPNATFFHSFSALLLGYMKLTEHQSGHNIFLNIKGNLQQITVFENNKLLFSNAFEFKNSKDFIYYVMLIYDQFNLKAESTPLTISGLIVENSEIYRLLYRYVRHINLVSTPSYLRFANKINAVPKYFYFDLFSLKLCES